MLAYWQKVFTVGGAVAAFTTGFLIGVFGHISWLLLLFIFLITSFAATKYKFLLKQKKGVQEGIRGERRSMNVLANGLVPVLAAVLTFDYLPVIPKNIGSILFLTAISAAAADTLASEIGVLSERTYLITNLKSVKAGTSGGVSIRGELSAVCASAYTSFIGWLFLTFFNASLTTSYIVLIPFGLGIAGCHLDSLFGATLEKKGIFTKGLTNFVSIGIVTLTAWCILQWI